MFELSSHGELPAGSTHTLVHRMEAGEWPGRVRIADDIAARFVILDIAVAGVRLLAAAEVPAALFTDASARLTLRLAPVVYQEEFSMQVRNCSGSPSKFVAEVWGPDQHDSLVR